MDEEAGAVVVSVDADTTAYNQKMADVQSTAVATDKAASTSADNVGKSYSKLGNTLGNLHSSWLRIRAAISNVATTFDQSRASGDSLGTTLTKTAGAAGGLATVIGGALVGTALFRLGIALVSATTQYTALNNQLVATTQFSGQVAAQFQYLQGVAANSNKGITELGTNYIALTKAAQMAGVSQTALQEAFAKNEAALKLFQQDSISGVWTKMTDAIGGAILKLDNLLGLSTLLISVFKTMGNAFTFISGGASTSGSPLDQQQQKLKDIAATVAQINQLQASGTLDAAQSQALEAQKTLLLAQEKQTQTDILALQEKAKDIIDLDIFVKRTQAQQDFNTEVEREVAYRDATNIDQEVANRLAQTELQYRQLGAALSKQELADMEAKIKMSVAAAQFKPVTEALQTPLEQENRAYSERLQALKLFYDTSEETQASYNDKVEKAEYIHQNNLTQLAQNAQQMQLTAQTNAINEGISLLGVFASKSKAAAIAQIVLQKGVAIALAIQNTAVAATKAMAELGPILGPPAAASIEAWGAVQIGLIAATGIASAFSAGASSGPSVAGASSTAGTAATDTSTQPAIPAGRDLIINMPKGQFYSSEQIQDLMSRINDEVQNGATLVSTSTVSA